jgi:hypothetical protein
MHCFKVFSLLLIMTFFGCTSRALRFQNTLIYKQFDNLQKTLSHSDSLSSSNNVFSLVGYPVKVFEENQRKYTIFSLGKPVYDPGRRTKAKLTRPGKSVAGRTIEIPAAITVTPVNSYFAVAAEMPILAYQTRQTEKQSYLYGFQAKKNAYKIKITKNALFDPHQSFFEYHTFPENDSFLVFTPIPQRSQMSGDGQRQAAFDEKDGKQFFSDPLPDTSPCGSPLILTLSGTAPLERSCLMIKSEGMGLNDWVKSWRGTDRPDGVYAQSSYASSQSRPVVIVSIGAVKDVPHGDAQPPRAASSRAAPANASSPNFLTTDFSFIDTVSNNAQPLNPMIFFSIYNFHLPTVPNSVKLSVSPIFIAEDRYELHSASVPRDFAARINYKKTREFYSKLAEMPPLKESYMSKSDIQIIREWLKEKK